MRSCESGSLRNFEEEEQKGGGSQEEGEGTEGFQVYISLLAFGQSGRPLGSLHQVSGSVEKIGKTGRSGRRERGGMRRVGDGEGGKVTAGDRVIAWDEHL